MEREINKFLDEYCEIDEIDRQKSYDLIKTAHKGNDYQKELELRWYKSLELGEIDYSIYGDKYYFTDIFYCWWKYSRKYIQLLSTLNYTPKKVIDVGNGIGYSTRQLKEIYPDAEVIGLNVIDTLQYKFNLEYCDDKGYRMIDDLSTIDECDLIFASEFLEHIQKPIEYLDKFIRLNPKYIVLANSFNTYSMGHFTTYIVDDKEIDQTKISRIVNAYLKGKNYKKVKTKFWNNKPTIWMK
jgi:hypothetical protein